MFSFGKEEAVPVRHDKIKKKKKKKRKEFAPREKYDRLTQEVTFKKPHAFLRFFADALYTPLCKVLYRHTSGTKKNVEEGRREEGGESFHSDDYRCWRTW